MSTLDEPVRFGRLKLIGRSPSHYLANVQKQAAHLDIGSAVHGVLLLDKRVTFYPKLTEAGAAAPRRGKDWDAFAAENKGAHIVTRAEYEDCMRMVEAVRNNDRAMEVIRGVPEQTLLFDYMGRNCRTTPDVRGPDFVTELKTCKSSHPEEFRRHAMGYRYHAQMAFHCRGVSLQPAGIWPEENFIVAVESSPPYPVVVRPLTSRAIRKGIRLIDVWLERLLLCESEDRWPEYSDDDVEFDVSDEDEKRFGPDNPD